MKWDSYSTHFELQQFRGQRDIAFDDIDTYEWYVAIRSHKSNSRVQRYTERTGQYLITLAKSCQNMRNWDAEVAVVAGEAMLLSKSPRLWFAAFVRYLSHLILTQITAYADLIKRLYQLMIWHKASTNKHLISVPAFYMNVFTHAYMYAHVKRHR